MKLLRNLPTRISKSGHLDSWGIFWCDYCESEVERPLSQGKRCKSCGCVQYILSAKSNMGKKRTEGQREKMSNSQKGHTVTKETRAKQSIANSVIYGKNQAKEKRENISKKAKERLKNPENNPNWQGGKSFEIYPIEFKLIKKFILERDNYKCQYPGCTEVHDRLHVHHIDYDKNNNIPENLITLGTSCHSKTINKKKRSYWIEFYQNIIMGKVMECLL